MLTPDSVKYYYVTVNYNIHDLCLDEDSVLHGPFDFPEDRVDHFRSEFDEDFTDIVSVTFLDLRGCELVRSRSFTSSEGEFPEEDEI